MSSEIMRMVNGLAVCSKEKASEQVMAVCRMVTPQFYKTMSVSDIKAEKAAVDLFTADIDGATLAEMCKRAVLLYPKSRSENAKLFFDLNYILTFYNDAFNFVHCDSVEVKKGATKKAERYDDVKHILWQKWVDVDGEKTVGVIYDKKGSFEQHLYSPKDFEQMERNIEEVEF